MTSGTMAFGFSQRRSYRARVLVTAVFVAIALPAVVWQAATEGGGGWFLALWVVLAAVLLGWMVAKVGYEVRVDGDRLTWRTPLRTVTRPVADIVAVRPTPGGMAALVTASGERFGLLTRRGFRDFVDALRERQPDLEVTWDPRWTRAEQRVRSTATFWRE